jgi:molybdenum cofactor cytidylyltransferase
MRFGPVPLPEAEGAILAHSVALPEGRLRKGCQLGTREIAQLRATGRTEVIVARLDPQDLHEDAAALMLARALVPDPESAGLDLRPVGTGRVNLHARRAGVVEVLADRVNALNAVDPMITFATVPRWQRLGPGEMAATVKVIAYGVPGTSVAAACAAGATALRLCPAKLTRVALLETHIDSSAKRLGVDAITQRLDALGATLAAHLHRAGGRVDRFGMPVDPGNLLFLGSLNGSPVIGLPGCARSPALNGADWVMERLICGVPVTAADIAGMGVGGLLKEIPTRGRLREARE